MQATKYKVKTQNMERRLTIRLTKKEYEFKQAHPRLNFSANIREALDAYIKNFDENEYQRNTRGD